MVVTIVIETKEEMIVDQQWAVQVVAADTAKAAVEARGGVMWAAWEAADRVMVMAADKAMVMVMVIIKEAAVELAMTIVAIAVVAEVAVEAAIEMIAAMAVAIIWARAAMIIVINAMAAVVVAVAIAADHNTGAQLIGIAMMTDISVQAALVEAVAGVMMGLLAPVAAGTIGITEITEAAEEQAAAV